jgi:hypothetical protein
MTAQITRDDLKSMTPQEIEQARVDGRLDRILGLPEDEIEAKTRARGNAPLTTEDVKILSRYRHHDLITAAHTAGRITEEN